MSIRKIFFVALLAISFFWGCTPQKNIDRSYVSGQLQVRTGYNLANGKQPGQIELPGGVEVRDGISEDEAIRIALWNNQQFQADLSSLAIAHADVIDASIVANPLLRYLSPNAGIMASGYINFALDFLWQRPKRIAAAGMEAERVAASMIQRGFALIRDVQLSYADMQLAKRRAAILAENAAIRSEMSRLSNIRLRHGDISELEALTFRADSANAVDQSIVANLDTILQRNRTLTLLGFSPDTSVSLLLSDDTLMEQKVERSEYLELATAYQPDLLAATMAIEAAAKKLGWERSRIISFTAVLNYEHLPGNSSNKSLPNAFNPGFQVEVPLLNRNQGKIARAKAELQQAAFQFVSVRQRMMLELSDAYNRYEEMHNAYRSWSAGTIPALEEALKLVQVSYARGDISYLPVLESLRQLVNGKLRKAEIEAALRRAVSQLNYNIGRNANPRTP